MRTAPYDLVVDGGGDGFPVTGAAPRLSWKDPVDRDVRTPYRVEAVIDGAPPAVVVVIGRRLAAWPFAALRSGQRVRWRVAADGPGADAAWSDWSGFEAGLLDEDWTANWISPVEAPVGSEGDPGYGKRPAHVLAGRFALAGPVVSARFYTTALGVYTATVNGARVGTIELAPGSTSYDRTLYAQATDVTSLLQDGDNAIELELSDGWFRGQVGAFRLPAGWGTTLGARAELHLELADGSRRVVRSDETWTSRPSAITRADLMDGQTLDLGASAQPEASVLLDVVDAPPAIDWSPAPPVRVVETRTPVELHRLADGRVIADFGQNASGWIRLTDLGVPGTRTVIDYGEALGRDGDLDTSHLDSERPEGRKAFVQRDEVVAGEPGGEFEPRHTVHGFRYARIARSDGGAPAAASVQMRIVQTDLRRTGAFECSDETLNRLHGIADWSFRGNAVDVPTDCPTRERLAWTGDYQVFAPMATRLYDVLGFSRKWLRSVRDDQLDDGRIANFSPDGRRIKHHLDDQFAMMTGSSGWGDAIVAVPWELYLAYGDEQVLAENVDAMIRWVDWALEQARTTRHFARMQASAEPEPFEQYLWDGTFHWGEWTEPTQRDADGNRIDPIKHNPMAWFMADKGEVGTAYLHRSTATLARIAGILGRDEDAARYAATAKRIADAWRQAYLRPDGTTTTDTQAAYVRALEFGLVPAELREAALERLVELIREAGTHVGTGFLATGDLLQVLADHGRADVAYELLQQRTAPSWRYMLDRGATTIWEDWEGIDEHGDAHESLNHYSKGAAMRFLHTHTLGLRQEADSIGWERVVIAPVPGGGITWARGSYESPHGTIAVEWRLEGERLQLMADIPSGTTARVILPDGAEHLVGAGRFEASATISDTTHALNERTNA
ncbi:family 78 glycoside hydrolase catalytic domain [Agromyces seonyuensis]|uniref:alpha-L-rhamnosidase n=1 Tax=Agromyces seonyuensis TaxID=2662446 RepID=A0A6I4NTK3_9MICO|nr:family 78 glycoside hydrolase catalytic domain [Agromyces seonyuensis]MWB97590.1 family 78 glycoside hydrolase catalytic domain [Agromyces seonyuensis]